MIWKKQEAQKKIKEKINSACDERELRLQVVFLHFIIIIYPDPNLRQIIPSLEIKEKRFFKLKVRTAIQY